MIKLQSILNIEAFQLQKPGRIYLLGSLPKRDLCDMGILFRFDQMYNKVKHSVAIGVNRRLR